jgi:NADH dehydrogenase/putative oxidoreductase
MNMQILRRIAAKTADFTLRVLRAVVWPKVDLAVRLWIGQIFFVSGVLKFANWSTALDLATHEYPLSWLSPVAAATLGGSIEVIGGTLLMLGLMSRYAAVPTLGLALVIQFNYMPFDNQLFWAALFGWYAVHGAGSVSLDQLLRKGLADSALPLVPQHCSPRIGPHCLTAWKRCCHCARWRSCRCRRWQWGFSCCWVWEPVC